MPWYSLRTPFPIKYPAICFCFPLSCPKYVLLRSYPNTIPYIQNIIQHQITTPPALVSFDGRVLAPSVRTQVRDVNRTAPLSCACLKPFP